MRCTTTVSTGVPDSCAENDTITPPSQARALAEALDQRAVPRACIVSGSEGHVLRREENIARAPEAELAHFRRYCAGEA